MTTLLKKSILILMLFIFAQGFAQSGYHTPSCFVTFASYNKDRSKLLTVSGDEVILYDCIEKKEIWKLLPSQLNLEVTENPQIYATIDENLTQLRVAGNKAGLTLLNIPQFVQAPLPDSFNCTKSGKTIIAERSKKVKYANQYDYFLYDPVNKAHKLLVKNCFKAEFMMGSNLIVFFFNAKDFYLDYEKTKFYDTDLEQFVDKPYPNFKNPPTTLFRDSNSLYTNSEAKKIIIIDNKTNKSTVINTKYKPIDYSTDRYYNGFVAYGAQENTVEVLECEERDGLKYSYICTYNTKTLELLNVIELSNDSLKDVALTLRNERKKVVFEKMKTYSATEYDLLDKYKTVAGKFVFHSASKHLMKILPDQKPDALGKVKVQIICHDRKKEIIEYMHVNDIVNTAICSFVRNYTTCTNCNGNGKFSKSAERTVWDATISAGAKIVETQTVKGDCSICGGYGIIPIF